MAPWAISMDAPEYADLSKLDPWHLPLNDMARAAGQSGPISTPCSPMSPTAPGGRGSTSPPVSTASRFRSSTGRAGTTTSPAASCRTSSASKRRRRGAHPSDGRPLGPRGQFRAHDQGDLHARAADRQGALGHLSAFLRPLSDGDRQRLRPRRPRALFTIGADRWQVSQSWPPATHAADPVLSQSQWPARRSKPTGDAAPDRFTYDPADPVVETVGLNCWAVCGQLGDRRPIEARADVLNYTTPRLDADLELTGPISAKLYAGIGCRRHRFHRGLERRLPDGTSNPIQDGIIRASAREDAFDPTPIERGASMPVTSTSSPPAYLVKAGPSDSRLDLVQLSSTATTGIRIPDERLAPARRSASPTRKSTARPRIPRIFCCRSSVKTATPPVRLRLQLYHGKVIDKAKSTKPRQ